MTGDEALATLFAMANVQDGYAKKATDPGLKLIHKANAKAQREVAITIKDLRTRLADAEADRDRLAAANKALEDKVRELEQSRDVVSWLDNGEKTYFSWAAGGGHPEGEFSSIGLRRETPDGLTLFRDYRATGPWHASTLAEVQADALREGGE